MLVPITNRRFVFLSLLTYGGSCRCVQRNQYDLGQEAVHRFKLSPEEAASLQLAQWVDTAVSRASVRQNFQSFYDYES